MATTPSPPTAKRLGLFVRYLHCKGVVHDAGRLGAGVPDDGEQLARLRRL